MNQNSLLTASHIDRLEWICDEDGFITDTEALVKLYNGLPNAESVVGLSKEKIKLMKVLEGLSADMRYLLVTSRINMHFHINDGDGLQVSEEHDPVYLLMEALDNIVVGKDTEKMVRPDGIYINRFTKCQRVSRSALKLIKKYDIHYGTSNTGAFVKYLSIVFDAMGEDYNPHNAARAVLK